MKIIAFCLGKNYTFVSATKSSSSSFISLWSKSKYELQYSIPDEKTVKSLFPSAEIPVFFTCPDDDAYQPDIDLLKTGGGHASCTPVFKILIDDCHIYEVDNGLGTERFINKTHVIDILSARLHLNEVQFYDFRDSNKTVYFKDTFAPHLGHEHYLGIVSRIYCNGNTWLTDYLVEANNLTHRINLELTHENTDDRIKTLFTLCHDEIEKLISTGGTLKYYFSMLVVLLEFFQLKPILTRLDEESIIKLDLLQAKLIAHKNIGNYICYWKFSLFGHHKNNLAIATERAIFNCTHIDQIYALLIEQRDVCEKDPQRGKYYKSILKSLNTIEQLRKNATREVLEPTVYANFI